MSRSREELKEIAKQILDYRRNDHSKLFSSLTPEELREITPLFKEITDEQIAKEREERAKEREERAKEREEHEAFMKEQEEKNREHRRFLAETDRFIARYKAAERKAPKPFLFPFPLGEA